MRHDGCWQGICIAVAGLFMMWYGKNSSLIRAHIFFLNSRDKFSHGQNQSDNYL